MQKRPADSDLLEPPKTAVFCDMLRNLSYMTAQGVAQREVFEHETARNDAVWIAQRRLTTRRDEFALSPPIRRDIA